EGTSRKEKQHLTLSFSFSFLLLCLSSILSYQYFLVFSIKLLDSQRKTLKEVETKVPTPSLLPYLYSQNVLQSSSQDQKYVPSLFQPHLLFRRFALVGRSCSISYRSFLLSFKKQKRPPLCHGSCSFNCLET